MQVQKIRDGVVAAFFGKDELERRGGFSSTLANTLAREAFENLGSGGGGGIYVDAYVNACGLMLFAELEKEGRQAVRFNSLESLLAYIPFHPKSADSALFLSDSLFCLVSDSFSDKAGEYGEFIPCTEELLSSHALIEASAASKLISSFGL